MLTKSVDRLDRKIKYTCGVASIRCWLIVLVNGVSSICWFNMLVQNGVGCLVFITFFREI